MAVAEDEAEFMGLKLTTLFDGPLAPLVVWLEASLRLMPILRLDWAEEASAVLETCAGLLKGELEPVQ